MKLLSFAVVLLASVFASATLAAAEKAPAGPPPDGMYKCTMTAGGMLMTLGKLELRDGRYRGLSGDRFAPYTVDAQGVLTLSAGLRGLPDDTTLEEVKHVGTDRRGRPLIKIFYRSANRARQVIDAVLQN